MWPVLQEDFFSVSVQSSLWVELNEQ